MPSVTEPYSEQLVDPVRLSAWVDEQPQLPGSGPVEVQRYGDGHSNLTFLVTRAGSAGWVLRRPPRGPLLPTAHDVLREYRVLALLGQREAGVRVPRVLGACDDIS